MLEDILIDSATDPPILSAPVDNAFVPVNDSHIGCQTLGPGSSAVSVVSSVVDLNGLDYFEYHEVALGGETTPTTGSKTTLPALSTAGNCG